MAKRFYPQERHRTCVVASLRSVLASQFGVHVREDVLRFGGDDAHFPILKYGTTTADLRRMLGNADAAFNTGPRWRLKITVHGTVAALARAVRAGRYPLVSVVRPESLHMVVVCGYKPGRVRYFDPADGVTRWCGSGEFRRQWLDVGSGGITWFAVVTGGRLVSA